jgi:pimeloyl-ACP methyl ester carboxylesterase
VRRGWNRLALAAAIGLLMAGAGQAQDVLVPASVTSDPPHDAAFPARMAVIHVPSGQDIINGVVYVASGPGPHPTFVFFHGLPGNERNLDLVQAVRRAGWNAVAVNYRGSWGSGGVFRFAQNLEDADAVLRYVRDPANAKTLGIDPARIALGGHSMGGWVTVETLAHDPGLLGAVAISAADMGAVGLAGRQDRAKITAMMNDNREALAGVTGASMADEVAAHADAWTFAAAAPKLVDKRLYMLTSDDGLAPGATGLVKAVERAGGKAITTVHVATDHGWSDKRIMLQALVVNWLATLGR